MAVDTEAIKNHIRRVIELSIDAAQDIEQRGEQHDQSKLVEPEASAFAKCSNMKNMVFNSAEYNRSLKDLGPALQHHYANNSHHPEHYPEGIEGMNLFDLLEMLLDWKASSERCLDGNLHDSIIKNTSRFGLDDVNLAKILQNTEQYIHKW